MHTIAARVFLAEAFRLNSATKSNQLPLTSKKMGDLSLQSMAFTRRLSQWSSTNHSHLFKVRMDRMGPKFFKEFGIFQNACTVHAKTVLGPFSWMMAWIPLYNANQATQGEA